MRTWRPRQEPRPPGRRTTARTGFGAPQPGLLSPSTGLQMHRQGYRPALREQRVLQLNRRVPSPQGAAFPAVFPSRTGPQSWPMPAPVPVPAPRARYRKRLNRLNRQMPSPQDAAVPAAAPSRAGVPGWPAPVPRVRNPTRLPRRMPSPASPAGPPARVQPERLSSPGEDPSSPWHYPRFASIADTSCGTTVRTSPTTPKSAISKIGASASLLTAMMVFAVCMPARCWMAPEMPSAM